MKVYAIPTAVAGLAAALSVLFFTGLSRVMGDDLLGQVILVQSAVAMVTIACVPQCWVYLLAAKGREEQIVRYRQGFTAEAFGFALCALIIGSSLMLPIAKQWGGGLIIFASLAVQASSSCQGWLRSSESWYRYTLWVLGPNLVRVPLIWATPSLVARDLLFDARGDQVMVMAIYFLAPDLVRWLLIAVPIAFRYYRWPGSRETIAASRMILQNWLFDVGSAVTDIGDKVVVGSLLGPQTLAAYFFARRLGVVATMVCEPFYAEQYRRTETIKHVLARSKRQVVVYKQGLSIAVTLSVIVMTAVAVAMQVPIFANIIPAAVLASFPLFVMVFLVDCMLSANRWSRFVAQLNGGAARLLRTRTGLFGLFVFNVWIFGNQFAGLGLPGAFAVTWLLEAGYICVLLREVRKRALVGVDSVRKLSST